MHLGTLTDYMIRKFFRDKLIAPDAEIILERPLISEISLDHIYHKVDDHCSVLVYRDDIGEEETMALYEKGTMWVDHYKNKPWKDIIQDIWLMSALDALYRSGHFPRIKPLEKLEINELEIFFENILEWLQKTFSSAKKVYLNPSLGVKDFVKADADLIIDNCLVDIKTTKHPHKAPNNDVNQLLIYASLCHHHSVKKIQNFPEIKKIAFILPQQLVLWERDLHDFTKNEKENMISKLKDLSEGIVGVLYE